MTKLPRSKYNNRDISWLSFNYRVLLEACDKDLPVYERLKFLAIYSNNLEEFYRVRVSYYREMLRNIHPETEKFKEVQPDKIISHVNKVVSSLQILFEEILENQIIPELQQNNIILLKRNAELNESDNKYLLNLFNCDILPHLQPVILIKNKVKPFLKTGQIYLVIKMFSKTKKKLFMKTSQPKYGLIKLPTDHRISRFFQLPQNGEKYRIAFLEDIVMRYINVIFPGYVIKEWYSIKITRDGDFEYSEEVGDELIGIIENISYTRQLGKPNRFQYDIRMPKQMLSYVCETFDITQDDIVKAGRYQNFRDFFEFPNPLFPKLENLPLQTISIPELSNSNSLLDLLEEKEFLLSFPYHSFNYFLRFLNDAANDDSVTEIMATQYRVAKNSAVVLALINAAQRGKKVTVFVELKARFDEEVNLKFAKEMKIAGINIIYSLPILKVHSKAILIKRVKNGTIKTTAFLSTGNFNEKTAKIYCDFALFTSDKEITKDLSLLFEILSGNKKECTFKNILVPNYNMIEKFHSLIDNEINSVRQGKEGYIILKMNGIDDPVMIDKLYEASVAGVKIDCLIRGVCCIKTEQTYSKNIRVIRIIDSYLEHSRVFVFQNDGNPLVYLGSADWMRRNLYKRIECVFPIFNKTFKQELIDILNIQLQDNVKATLLDENAQNVKIYNNKKPIRSQYEIYEYLKKKEEKELLEYL